MTNSSVEAPRAATRKAGIWQAVLLLAGSCLPVLGAVLITPILPQLSAVFAGEPGAEVLVPMIVAIPALMIAIFAPFAGQIVDRLGRKGLLIIAMVAYAFVGTAPAYLESLQLILLTRVGVGITEAAIMTVCTTLIVDYFHEEKQRNKYLGLQTVATTLAATVFIILGGALGVGGWHTPFWVYGISLVIAVPMLFLLWEPGRGDATDEHVASAGRVPVPWRRLRLPLVVALFGGFTFYVMLIETSYLLVENGVDASDTATIGAVAAGASLVTAAGAFSFPRLVRRGHRFVLPLAFGLQALGMLVIWAVGGVAGCRRRRGHRRLRIRHPAARHDHLGAVGREVRGARTLHRLVECRLLLRPVPDAHPRRCTRRSRGRPPDRHRHRRDRLRAGGARPRPAVAPNGSGPG